MIRFRFLLACAVLWGLLSPGARAFEISFTNSSEYSADDVYIWITAQAGYALTLEGGLTNLLLGHSYRLSDLQAGLEVEKLVGGRIYVSLGAPLPDPGRDASGVPVRDPGVLPGDDGYLIRHDFVELTYTPSQADVADLTSMDQFAIPLALQLRKGGVAMTGSNTFAGWKGHTDQQIVSALAPLVSPGGSNVLYNNGQFIRVEGATKFPDLYHNLPNDPHSMSAYLAAIKADGRATIIQGSALGQKYAYSAQLDASGNFVLTRLPAGDASTPQTIVVPASYKSGPNPADPTVTLAEEIYLSNPWYSVNGGTVGPTQNDVAGAVARDLFAALNLGYIDSSHVVLASETADPSLVGKHIYELTTDQMRSLKIAFSEVNGFYNLYADAIRQESDSYGYAYSDWNENLSKVAVLLNADHSGAVADELNIQISGSRNVTVPEPSAGVALLTGLVFLPFSSRFRRKL